MSRHREADRQSDQVTAARAEEARKEILRRRIAAMFGDSSDPMHTVVREQYDRFRNSPDPAVSIDDQARSGQPALDQFATEENDLSGANRGQYQDTLKQRYGDAERAVRFGAANTGNIGSTVYADAVGKLNRDNELGGTEIEQAVRRSIDNLRTSREQVRSQSLDLVNAGQGEEGVRSATAGIKSAAENAKAAQREQLFGDLFTNLAYTRVGQNNANQSAQLAALLNNRSGSFFPSTPSPGRSI